MPEEAGGREGRTAPELTLISPPLSNPTTGLTLTLASLSRGQAPPKGHLAPW